MSQLNPGSDRAEPALRGVMTTMSRTRGNIAVRIDGEPTYRDNVSGEVMISGPLAVRLDAMLAMFSAIEQFDSDFAPARAVG